MLLTAIVCEAVMLLKVKDPEPAACQLGGAPLLAVSTYPAVPELAKNEGTPDALLINTPLFTAVICPIVLVAEEYKI